MRLSGFAPSPNGEGWGGVIYFVTLTPMPPMMWAVCM